MSTKYDRMTAYDYAMAAKERAGVVADFAREMRTDLGPHAVTAHGTATNFKTLDAALKEYDDAARWARGYRWLTNLTTGQTVDTDNRG